MKIGWGSLGSGDRTSPSAIDLAHHLYNSVYYRTTCTSRDL